MLFSGTELPRKCGGTPQQSIVSRLCLIRHLEHMESGAIIGPGFIV